MTSKLFPLIAFCAAPFPTQAQTGPFISFGDLLNPASRICDSSDIKDQLAAKHAQNSARLRDMQRLLTRLRADEQATENALNLATANHRRALNGDELPSPEELRISAAVQPLLAALQSYYSLANTLVMWQNSLADLRKLGAAFDVEGRTQADLQKFIANLQSDQAKWTISYGSFEVVYSRLLQFEDQLAAVRAQRGATDVRAFRLARQQAETAFDTAKSKRRDAESIIESLEAQLVRITALQRASQNCPPRPVPPPFRPIPLDPPEDPSIVNIISRGRCGSAETFPRNDYTNTAFQLKLPVSGPGPISGRIVQNLTDPNSRPIPIDPQNVVAGSTNGYSASGTWRFGTVTATWSGTFQRNSRGVWESSGVFCNRTDPTTGCAFRWSNPQIALPIVTLSDLNRCLQ